MMKIYLDYWWLINLPLRVGKGQETLIFFSQIKKEQLGLLGYRMITIKFMLLKEFVETES